MRFVDECDIDVEAGNGGDGCIAFRREKFVPFGGPAGGDGGRGGDVILVADTGVGTLYDLYYTRTLKAEPGGRGLGKDCYGAGGSDSVLRVPLGTVIFDRDTGEKIGELVTHDERMVVVRGGRGGRGNKHFSTPVDRAPRRADPGEPGEKRALRLELKSMADVGLLGFPNVGKSTFISAVSRAHPKVADYPFTTLEPHLGVVALGESSNRVGKSFVVADIPGLIPGASEGLGLGLRFLRHVERTRLLLHMVTVTEEPEREPVADYLALRKELEAYGPTLAAHPEIVALTKADLPYVREAYPELSRKFAELGIELRLISSATHEGLNTMLAELAERLVPPAPPSVDTEQP
jgi:GTPase